MASSAQNPFAAALAQQATNHRERRNPFADALAKMGQRQSGHGCQKPGATSRVTEEQHRDSRGFVKCCPDMMDIDFPLYRDVDRRRQCINCVLYWRNKKRASTLPATPSCQEPEKMDIDVDHCGNTSHNRPGNLKRASLAGNKEDTQSVRHKTHHHGQDRGQSNHYHRSGFRSGHDRRAYHSKLPRGRSSRPGAHQRGNRDYSRRRPNSSSRARQTRA